MPFVIDAAVQVPVGLATLVRFRVVDAQGAPMDITGATIVATVVDPAGNELTPEVTIETQGGKTLGVFNYPLTAEETEAGGEGIWRFVHTMNAVALLPRGGVAVVRKGVRAIPEEA